MDKISQVEIAGELWLFQWPSHLFLFLKEFCFVLKKIQQHVCGIDYRFLINQFWLTGCFLHKDTRNQQELAHELTLKTHKKNKKAYE